MLASLQVSQATVFGWRVGIEQAIADAPAPLLPASSSGLCLCPLPLRLRGCEQSSEPLPRIADGPAQSGALILRLRRRRLPLLDVHCPSPEGSSEDGDAHLGRQGREKGAVSCRPVAVISHLIGCERESLGKEPFSGDVVMKRCDVA